LRQAHYEVIAARSRVTDVWKNDVRRNEAAVCGAGDGMPCGLPSMRAAMHLDVPLHSRSARF
jgi:hypothetical protein